MHAMAHRNCLEFSAAREHFMIRKVCSPESSNFLEDRSSPSAYLPVLPPSSRAAKWPLPTSRLTRLTDSRSEEHTSELQSRLHLVCRLLLEKKQTPTFAPPHCYCSLEVVSGAP